MKTITIIETKTYGSKWISNHRTNDDDIAINRAILKHFGKNAWFNKNYETSNNNFIHGQIFKKTSYSRSESITGMVTIDIN